jgi:hypothetical protein
MFCTDAKPHPDVAHAMRAPAPTALLGVGFLSMAAGRESGLPGCAWASPQGEGEQDVMWRRVESSGVRVGLIA